MMLMRSALLGAAALGASAMLVDPVTKSTKSDGLEITNHMELDEFNHATFDLTCAECPFSETNKEGKIDLAKGSLSSLELDFVVEKDRMLANGQQIFPPDPSTMIVAVQKNEDGKHSDPVSVGYALEIMPVPRGPYDEAGYDLLDLRFTVLNVGDRPVPVDTIAISFIQAPTGEIFIARAGIERTTPANKHTTWRQCNGNARCLQQLLMARIRGLLASAKTRFMGMATPGPKGCHGKLKGETMGHPGAHPHGSSGHGSPWPHHDHGHHAGLARTFSRVLHFIVFPVLIGLLAGLTASAVGMVVGHAVVFLWKRYRGPQPADRPAAWEEEEGEVGEKQGLVTEPRYSEEALPEYTEPSDSDSIAKD